RFVVPPKVDRVLRWAKYPILVAIIYFTWKTGTLVIRPYDPLAAYGHLSAGLSAVWAEFAVGFVILVLTLVLSMFYERVFCKYVCPLGAVNAILSRIPLFRIKRITTTCISCTKCDKACPMNIDISHGEVISSPECIACMECVTTCPTKKNSLETTLAGKTVGVGKIAALGLAIYLGTMGVGALLGKLDFVGPTLRQKATSGTLAIGDIKGSSTWAEVATAFGIDLERLYREAGVDASKVPPETKLKDTGALIGKTFEADTARFAVSKITGIPYAGENAAPAAVSPVPAPTPAPANTAPSSAPAASTTQLTVPPDFALEGTMTVKDVAAALKTSETAVIKKLQLPADFPTDKPLRDLKDQYGYT
ncbi:MAG: 4Fe-4S binding protein, partial [Rectinema subterraneum]|uniref:4Fe-4S binding protein n=1 Tax=Rectinema subterraneum TaxID=2653714 RepID=UPI003C79E357